MDAVTGQLERFARFALEAIHREHPYHLLHVVRSDEDVRPPRELTPMFWGAFDWHSAVHGHWALVRVLRFTADDEFAHAAEAALERSFTRDSAAGEVVYLSPPERGGFERPYGLAWLLQLCAELREWDDPRGRRWHETLEALESLAAARFIEWLPKLPWPDRSGQHAQTAFALGLVHDWAWTAGDTEMRALIDRRARDWYGRDHDAPIRFEPSGTDFLSPALAEADLMRRCCDWADFTTWISGFLPDVQSRDAVRWLTPVTSPDPADGKLAHLDGLNLSRAWMLEGISNSLDEDAPVHGLLAHAADRHREAGLAALTGEHYAGSHWLGTFAIYLLTGRGLGRAVDPA